MSSKEIKKSIIKDSSSIREFIKQRIKELDLKPAGIIKDAGERNMKIESAALSRYLKNGNCKGSLSEENIVWLCLRYGIDVMLIAGTPKIKDNKLKIELPPYNEEQALAKLKLIF